MPILGELHAEPILPKAFVFDVMGYQVFAEEVKAFHESTARLRIPTAPARTSKSMSAAAEIVFRALPHKPLLGSLQWIVGTNYETNKEFQYVWEWLIDERHRWTMNGKEIQIEKSRNNPGNGDMQIILDWGYGPHGRARSIIEGKSSTNDRSLQGEHVTQSVMSEAADHDRRIWEKYLSTRSTWAIFPTTPKAGATWLRELVEKGEKNPALGIEAFTYPPHANPLYDYEVYMREKQLAESRTESGLAEDDPFFAEQFLGHWVYYTGAVLPFRSQNLVTLDESWLDVAQLYISTDYGYEDACVALLWALLPSGAMLIWNEVYERHLTTHEFVQAIGDALGGRDAQVVYACGDPKQPQVARYLSDYGLHVVDVNKRAQADRAVGHRRLVDLLSVDPERNHPMLFVAEDRCPKTVTEWKHLRYRENMKNEYGTSALEGEDHAFDAARYFVMTRPQRASEPKQADWYQAWQRERRRAWVQENGMRWATRGLHRWASTGKSPYA